MTLLSPNDVRTFSSIRKLNFAPCDFEQIYQEELTLARKCFGLELWEAMIAAKVDYSAILEYIPGSSNAADVVVLYNGIYRKAKVLTTKDPSFESDWDNAPVFEGGCADAYDEFYCKYLGPFIANTILVSRLPFIRSQITQAGVINQRSDKYNRSSDREFDTVIAATQAAANLAWDNLEWYMKQDAQVALNDTCFKGWPPYEDDANCNTTKSGTRKRTGLYDFG